MGLCGYAVEWMLINTCCWIGVSSQNSYWRLEAQFFFTSALGVWRHWWFYPRPFWNISFTRRPTGSAVAWPGCERTLNPRCQLRSDRRVSPLPVLVLASAASGANLPPACIRGVHRTSTRVYPMCVCLHSLSGCLPNSWWCSGLGGFRPLTPSIRAAHFSY